jgi:hypothetical protein
VNRKHAWVLGVLTAVIAGAATPGGPVVGFSLGAVALKAGGGAPQVIAYVVAWALFAFQRLLLWEIPFMPARFVWSARRCRCRSRFWLRDRHGDREAVTPGPGSSRGPAGGRPLCYNITFSDGSFRFPPPRT